MTHKRILIETLLTKKTTMRMQRHPLRTNDKFTTYMPQQFRSNTTSQRVILPCDLVLVRHKSPPWQTSIHYQAGICQLETFKNRISSICSLQCFYSPFTDPILKMGHQPMTKDSAFPISQSKRFLLEFHFMLTKVFPYRSYMTLNYKIFYLLIRISSMLIRS